jgi:hypothetical protein
VDRPPNDNRSKTACERVYNVTCRTEREHLIKN